MADFTSSFWNWFIIIPTVGGIIGCFLLVRWLSGGTCLLYTSDAADDDTIVLMWVVGGSV